MIAANCVAGRDRGKGLPVLSARQFIGAASRHCYGLTYASQREALHLRGLGKAQKIRMRLGGSPETEEFPDKPKGMHWRTYDRLCRLHDAAEERSTIGLMHFVGRLGRRTSRHA